MVAYLTNTLIDLDHIHIHIQHHQVRSYMYMGHYCSYDVSFL
jgi:hypothetical protein